MISQFITKLTLTFLCAFKPYFYIEFFLYLPMAHLNITFSILIANVHINIKTAITRCVYILEYLRMKKKTN